MTKQNEGTPILHYPLYPKPGTTVTNGVVEAEVVSRRGSKIYLTRWILYMAEWRRDRFWANAKDWRPV